MKILSLNDILLLKAQLEKLGYQLHTQDACGGQTFWLEVISQADENCAVKAIRDFAKSQNCSVTFYESDVIRFSFV